ncbi:hypothetical protein [Kitasatospora sp. NPDC051914]|uniref:hypothetical protein n=1 Tax=Kitasatospora sp. NPDC051914 TaxID=3154945 RepID=UPI003413A672
MLGHLGEGRGERPAGRSIGYFAGIAPWVVFDVVAGPSTWEYAALAALVTGVVLGWPTGGRRGWKLLNVVGIAFFAVMTVLALVLDQQDLDWLETYAQVISSGVLAVVAFASLLFDPFTAQYARESVPEEYWDNPVFRHVNRVLTAVWGLTFALISVLGAIAVHTTGGDDWLNWVIPVVLIVAAVKFTVHYLGAVRRRTADVPGTGDGDPAGAPRGREQRRGPG